jgi:predicted metal-dependent hydrolase
VQRPLTNLEVRKPPFRIDESVAFQWQPANPGFGLFGNVFTFLAIAFERYLVSATRQAMDRIADPALAAEADAFVRQEAQHARAHRAHAKVMIHRYPGLQRTYDEVQAAYDELLDTRPLEFHLAYAADLEGTFTPLFRMMLDHRHALFGGADERVGTLFLWHFAEEIEHRRSALLIQRAVTPDRWYRLRQTGRVVRHVSGQYQRILDGFEEHVGIDACGIDPQAVSPGALATSDLRNRLPVVHRWLRPRPSMLADVPSGDLLRLARHVIRSQRPSHDPAGEELPAYADDWFAAYAAGDDITTYAGARL